MTDSERLGHLIRKYRARVNGYGGCEVADIDANDLKRLLDAADLGLFLSIETVQQEIAFEKQLTANGVRIAELINTLGQADTVNATDQLKVQDAGFENLDELLRFAATPDFPKPEPQAIKPHLDLPF